MSFEMLVAMDTIVVIMDTTMSVILNTGELAQRSDEPPAARWRLLGSRLGRGHRCPEDHVH